MAELAEALAGLADGAVLAVGGAGLVRKPMAALRAVAGAGRRDLAVVSFLGGVDVELLLEAGCVAELHSAGVSLDAAGLAPRFRATREAASIRFAEWSEGSLVAALGAGAERLDSALTRSGLGTDLPAMNPWLVEAADPHTGAPVMAARALVPDLALLHVPWIDAAGNAHVPGDLAADALLARAARSTLVTYEEQRDLDPRDAAISRIWIDRAVRAPGGSLPSGCHPVVAADLAAVGRIAAGEGV
jgi:glutaconate CoA-transferase subunit A